PVTVPFRTTFLLFSLTTPLPPISTPFPYTTLFRSRPSVLPSQSQTLWPILQGGTHVELRTEGLRRILDLGSWAGLAIGGLSVGEPKPTMHAMREALEPRRPSQLPGFIMGVGFRGVVVGA